FVTERIQSALSQIDVVDARPIVSDVVATPSAARPGSQLTISARVEDESDDPDVQLYVGLGSDVYEQVGMHKSPDLGPYSYSAQITAPSEPGVIHLYVSASDPTGQTTTSDESTVPVLGEIRIFINEFMAANSTALADPAGEYDDWLELYNEGPEEVNVAGFTLTDDPLRPGKWTLPDTSISAGGFLLIWADEDASQGSVHANFRLSRLGEYIGLFDAAGVTLDTLSFPAQAEDVSYGRSQDGGGSWVPQAIPTPGASNSGAVGVQHVALPRTRRMSAFPNPFRSDVTVTVEGTTGGRFEIFDVLGRRLAIKAVADGYLAEFQWVGDSSVPAGVYAIRYAGEDGRVQTTTIVRLR
ncbi:MAG: lamin tail domain-containing protein, partial [Rhodothermales bacterium]|nr:lamin tail domain-containing protein [Rhodothermales bacterium]